MAKINDDSRATIRTSMGDIVLEFINDKAPNTVENFVKLANKGFYDGLTFHRVIKGFMIQGGCPKGNGSGNPGYTIRPEFNDTPHVMGTVSMARSNDPHSAGSQFFICQGDARYLDSRYTAFARVAEGQDVVEKIASVPVNMETRYQEISIPRTPVYINTVKVDGVEFDDPMPQQRSGDGQGGGSGEAPEGGAESGSGGGKDEASGGGRSRGRGRGRGRGRDRDRGADKGADKGASGSQGGDQGGNAPATQDDSANNNRPPQAADGDRAGEAATETADAAEKKPARKAARSKAKSADKPAPAASKAKTTKVAKSTKATKSDDKPKPRAKKATVKKTTRKAVKKTTRSKGKDKD